MKLESKDRQILEHIIRYCTEIQMAVQVFGENEDIFVKNPVFLNACSMPLLQIGELARKLSDHFVSSSKEIPWHQIKGMRNFFAHDYRAMKKSIIWNTVIEDIPHLKQQCEQILQKTFDM